MNQFIYDIENKPETKFCVGNKAYNLFLIKDKVNVPPFIVLKSDFFLDILELPENITLYKNLKTIWDNKLSISNRIEELKEYIYKICIPKCYLEEIEKTLKNFNMSGPFAVRSSSIYEDMNNKSAPGIYESYLDVNIEDLEKYLKRCWASNFSLKTLFYFGNQYKSFDDIKMGIIIQEMKYADYAGIMFTANPIDGKEEIVVEMTSRTSEQLTDGDETGLHFVVNINDGTCSLDDNAVKKICKLFIDVRNQLVPVLNNQLDLEWCISDNEIFIIQVRPITTIKKDIVKNNEDPKICSISNLDEINKSNSALNRKMTRWCGKKQHFYRSCDNCNVNHLAWYFIENYDARFEKKLRTCLEEFHGEYVTFAINETLIDVVEKKENALKFIENFFQNKGTVISIRDIPLNEISVISRYLENDTIYIEAIDGIMKGLKTGELMGAKYKVDGNGKFIYKNDYHESLKYKIEFPSGKTYLVKNDNTSFSKYEELFIQIATKTRSLYKDSQKGSIEWWVCNNEVYAADISLEKDDMSYLDCSESESMIISEGIIDGSLYVIPESIVEEINNYSFGVGISVDFIDSDIMNENIYKSLQTTIADIAKSQPVIIAIKKPYLGIAPILKNVSGVIFEDASMLCHLSVMLREKNIPAVAVGKSFSKLKSNEKIYMNLEGVKKC
ncbi:PEP/pyruvate-binding domain-containing protein [Treponema bryantii]|uniref:PEP/pyruvate-binding domain-containing protein n=1 Tax=Treponema bryantii TaxID=163 RepID=UPI002B2B1112|nr:hypothetical protein TRBR_26820 [Treponema bryantii]